MKRLQIGWATRDVSTHEPINIPGQFHKRISVGVLDPITVTALVLDSGDDIAIFLSGDFVYLREYLIQAVREEIRRRNPLIPVEKIMFNATHTHCSPSYSPESEETFPPHEGIEIASSDAYRAFLVIQVAEAIMEAYENKRDGGIAYGYGYAVTGHSRRTLYMDDLSLRTEGQNPLTYIANGHAAMYGNTNDPMFSGYEAGSHAVMNVLYTFDAEDRLSGAIINVPCPSQNSENESFLSADFWHNVRDNIRTKYGPIHILPQCAAAGDLAPRILHDLKAQERRYRLKYSDTVLDEMVIRKSEYYERLDIAERIAACFDEVFAWASRDLQKEVLIRHQIKDIELEPYPVDRDYYESYKRRLEHYSHMDYVHTNDTLADFTENSKLDFFRNQCIGAISRYENQDTQTGYPMELHVLQVGEVAFATNPFELYMDFQHRIQARSPFVQTFIVQLSTPKAYPGYLATERAAAGRGYSAIPASCRVSPAGGQQLVEETVQLLQELAATNEASL